MSRLSNKRDSQLQWFHKFVLQVLVPSVHSLVCSNRLVFWFQPKLRLTPMLQQVWQTATLIGEWQHRIVMQELRCALHSRLTKLLWIDMPSSQHQGIYTVCTMPWMARISLCCFHANISQAIDSRLFAITCCEQISFHSLRHYNKVRNHLCSTSNNIHPMSCNTITKL